MIGPTAGRLSLGLAVILSLPARPGDARADEACKPSGDVYSVLKLSAGHADAASTIIPSDVPLDTVGVHVQACDGPALLAALKRGDNLDELLAKRVVLVIVEAGMHLEHYVIPYMKATKEIHGMGLVPAFPLCGGEGRDAQCRRYLPQLQALLTASIAFEDLRKAERSPCQGAQGLYARIQDAHARLAPYLRDPAVRALDQSLLVSRDNVLESAKAAQCGPRELNQKAAQSVVVSLR
jgi:hypothetical protein